MTGRVKPARLVSRPEAVRMLGVSDRALDRLVAEGVITPAVARSGRRPSMFDAVAVRECARLVKVKAAGADELGAALCSKLDAQSRTAARWLAETGLEYLKPLLASVGPSRTVRDARTLLSRLQAEIIDIKDRTLTGEAARACLQEISRQVALQLREIARGEIE